MSYIIETAAVDRISGLQRLDLSHSVKCPLQRVIFEWKKRTIWKKKPVEKREKS